MLMLVSNKLYVKQGTYFLLIPHESKE